LALVHKTVDSVCGISANAMSLNINLSGNSEVFPENVDLLYLLYRWSHIENNTFRDASIRCPILHMWVQTDSNQSLLSLREDSIFFIWVDLYHTTQYTACMHCTQNIDSNTFLNTFRPGILGIGLVQLQLYSCTNNHIQYQ